LPLLLIGFLRIRDSFLWCLLTIGIFVPVTAVFFPSTSLPYWNRWVYILVYPLMFVVAEGFDRLWHTWPNAKKKFKHLTPKLVAALYLLLLLTLSGFYLTTSPEHAFPYFSQYNPYLSQIPSSMLQTTVSVEDAPALVDCFNWLNKCAGNDSVVVCHYALYDWATIFLKNKSIISTPLDNLGTNPQTKALQAYFLVSAANSSLAVGHVEIFTVWWVSGKGWFQIPTLPVEFRVVYESGNMAVYSYNR
jgi:hypothetical protein